MVDTGEAPRLIDNPWVPIVLAGAAWASGNIATKAALDAGLGSFGILAGRYLFGVLALVVGMAATGRLALPDRAAMGKGAILGVVNMALPTVFLTIALETLSASLGGILIALIPTATIVAAHFTVAGERFDRWRLPGLGVAFVGVAVLLGGDGGGSTDVLRGFAYSLVGVAIAGLGGALSRRYALQVPAVRLVLPQFLAGALFMAVTALPFGGWGDLFDSGLFEWGLVSFLGAVSTAVPFFAFLWAVQIAPAAKAGLVGYLVPLFSVIGAVLLLGDRVTLGLVVGGALILGGVFLADRGAWLWGRLEKRVRPYPPAY